MPIANQVDKNPRISIIVPIYGVEEYLNQCVVSLIRQSYRHIEILLIDDGSPDKCGEICDAWEKRDSRIRVFHTTNHGVSHARNIGLDNFQGDYVGFCDADDWIDSDMYEQMMELMLRNDADICGAGYVCETMAGKQLELRVEQAKIWTRDEAIEKIFGLTVPKPLSWGLWDKLIKKELVTKVRFNESIHMGEDMLFFWETMKSVHRFYYAPLLKYHYRTRANSAVHGGLNAKTLTLHLALEKILANAQHESDIVKKTITARYQFALVTVICDMICFYSDDYREYINKYQAYMRQHFVPYIFQKDITIRQRMEGFVACLPFRLCLALRVLVPLWHKFRLSFPGKALRRIKRLAVAVGKRVI